MAEQELKKISQAELDEILKQHKLWLKSKGAKGKLANLSFCDVRKLKFPIEVDLRNAYLRGIDFRKVYLRKADLRKAYIIEANLVGTILIEADLRGAHLLEADLRGADFMEADLRDTDLRDTDLRRANLENAKIDNAKGIQNIHSTTGLEARDIQKYLQIQAYYLEQELQEVQVRAEEKNQSKEHQEKFEEVKKQLKLARKEQQEQQEIILEKNKEIQKLTEENKNIQSVLETNIEKTHEALTNALINTETQIQNNWIFATLSGFLALILIGLDIIFILQIPQLITDEKSNNLLDKVGMWGSVFFTFPALLILLIALSLLRHQKQLIAEIRHYSMLKHKIELYGGILKAATHTASSLMQSQNSEAAKYIKDTFDEIKTELLKSPHFDLNTQPHIFSEEGGNLVEMLKSITELLKISTEANKAIAESAKKATTSEK